jgi:hypothetical protein
VRFFSCHAFVTQFLFDLLTMESNLLVELLIEALASKESLQLSNERSH